MDHMQRQTSEFLQSVYMELFRARAKFPSANLSFVALVEETGELANALLKLRGAVAMQNSELIEQRKDAVVKEAIQVATMACRVATETDESFDVFVSNPSAL